MIRLWSLKQIRWTAHYSVMIHQILLLIHLYSLIHFLKNDPFAFTDTFICQDSIYSYCRWYNYRDWFSYKLWYYFYSLILWGVTMPFLFYGSFVCYVTILIIDSVGYIDTIMANVSFAYLIQYYLWDLCGL